MTQRNPFAPTLPNGSAERTVLLRVCDLFNTKSTSLGCYPISDILKEHNRLKALRLSMKLDLVTLEQGINLIEKSEIYKQRVKEREEKNK